ncbi:ABC transporter permease [Actinomyces procaprae]|uniref:ABC transporter permease n=1 Tax=Actinomyces procaprae TaxID=2560010 RepID=UPI0010A294A0|nr:ABC transporter permease [Actinomyces procaprae]
MTPFKALTVSLARTNLRDPATMFFSYVFPPALLVVLALTMGDQPGVDGYDIVDFISPNVTGFGIAFVGMFTGATTIVEWREKGVGRVLRSAPMTVSSILASALTVAVVSALVQAMLVVLTGLVPAVGVTLTPWALLAVVPVFLGTLVFYSLGMLVGLALPTLTAVSLAVMIVVLPMAFASGAVLPLEMMPGWMQTLSDFLPLTYLLDALRWPLTGVAELSDALIGLGVTGTTGAALFWAATKLTRWT